MTDNPNSKPRKKRRDSQAEKAKVVQGAGLQLQAPGGVALDARGQAFFAEILEEQAKSHWTRHSLSFAAQIASMMSLLQKIKEQVDDEGYTIVNVSERGQTRRAHPLLSTITTLSSTIVSMRRSLALHARGKAGDNRKAGAQRAYGRKLEDEAAHADDLIPGLRLVSCTERQGHDE